MDPLEAGRVHLAAAEHALSDVLLPSDGALWASANALIAIAHLLTPIAERAVNG